MSPNHRTSADYNIFGYDPGGFIAHLAALFYGPDWRPRYLGLRPFYVGVAQPPRYGAPAIHQKACLPKDFKACLPPHYYGVPQAPYLPSPTQFHPDFAAVLKGLRCVEALERMEVCSVIINYAHNLVKMQFTILTNESYASVCGRLQIDPDLTQLEYRTVSDGIYSENFYPLSMELDWCYAMMSICQANKEHREIAVDIMQIGELRQKGRCAPSSGSCLDAGRRLSLGVPRIKTYPFIYPTISDLIEHLNVRDYLLESSQNVGGFWGADIIEVLNGGAAAMEFIDELTLISPRGLHLATGIPAWRIGLIYEEAMRMIRGFHLSMDDDIKDIKQMRKNTRRRE